MLKLPSALIAACAAPVLFAQPASAEVVEQGDSSFVTRDAVVVEADPYEAWQALIVPSKWWNSNHTWSADAENLYISAQAGGCFCELLPPPNDPPEGVRRGSAHHMTVVLADPPKALRMRGGLGPLQSEPVDGVLTITLTPTDKGTVIVFEYVVGGYMRFKTPDIAKAVDGVMSQQLMGLAKLLGPVKAGPSRAEAKDPADTEPDGSGDETDGEVTAEDASDAADTKTADTKTADKAPAKKSRSVEEAFGPIADD